VNHCERGEFLRPNISKTRAKSKKRPFCFVLKQENSLKRDKIAVFHIKTPCKGVGEESPCLQPCPSVTLERSDRVQGKYSVTPSCGRSPPRNAPASPQNPVSECRSHARMAMTERHGVSAKKITPGESPAFSIDWNFVKRTKNFLIHSINLFSDNEQKLHKIDQTRCYHHNNIPNLLF
jgi:hypothetical protein